MCHLRLLFPQKTIPDPLWIKPFFWAEGAHYWKQRPVKYKNDKRNPYSVCGEVVSLQNQGWIEGALDSVERGLSGFL